MNGIEFRVLELPDVRVCPKVVDVYRPVNGACEVHAHLFIDMNEVDHPVMIEYVLSDVPIVLIARIVSCTGWNVRPDDDISRFASTND